MAEPSVCRVWRIRAQSFLAAQVGTIIWATGFTAKFDWIRLPILDGAGMPIHERGVSPVPGIYFVGLPWLYKRKSGFIYGIAEDAQYIVNIIARQLNNEPRTITTSQCDWAGL